MLGFGALGQFPLGGGPYGTTTVTAIGWFAPLSDPVRFICDPSAAIAVNHQTLAFNPLPIVSFAWFDALSEPVRQLPALPVGEQPFHAWQPAPSPFVATGWFNWLSEPVRSLPALPAGEQQFFALNPLPRVSFSWFNELSKPQKLERIGLAPAYQQTLALYPNPLVSFSWFDGLSEPVRLKPGLLPALQQFFAIDTSVIPLTELMEWFAALSEPVRFKLGVGPWLQQFMAAPSQLRPNPTITGTLSAIETKDVFLGGAMAWNRVISGEIGVIEASFTGAEIGVVEQALSTGTSGAIELAAAPTPGTASPVITAAHISIRII